MGLCGATAGCLPLPLAAALTADLPVTFGTQVCCHSLHTFTPGTRPQTLSNAAYNPLPHNSLTPVHPPPATLPPPSTLHTTPCHFTHSPLCTHPPPSLLPPPPQGSCRPAARLPSCRGALPPPGRVPLPGGLAAAAGGGAGGGSRGGVHAWLWRGAPRLDQQQCAGGEWRALEGEPVWEGGRGRGGRGRVGRERGRGRREGAWVRGKWEGKPRCAMCKRADVSHATLPPPQPKVCAFNLSPC